MIEFGQKTREAYFFLDPDAKLLNHGSFGACPRPVYEARLQKLAETEFQPDTVIHRNFGKEFFSNVNVVANFLGCNPKNLTLVMNPTNATNSVLKSLRLGKGDGMLLNNWTYIAVRNTCIETARLFDAHIVDVRIDYPIHSKQQILDAYADKLKEDQSIKIAVIETITSPTATQLPYKELTDMLVKKNILVLIDGAHSAGQHKLEIESIGCHFFTGTMHKWSYHPRGCSFLWVRPDMHQAISPVLTSHNYVEEDWRRKFLSQGTRDNSTLLVCQEAVQFYSDIGGLEEISDYCENLVEKAADEMSCILETERFPIPPDMQAPFMRLIELPKLPKYLTSGSAENYFSSNEALAQRLFEDFNCHAMCLTIGGRPWIRISANIYNSLEEYQSTARIIKSFAHE